MKPVGVLLAGGGPAVAAELVACFDAEPAEWSIVRRCLDLAELLAASRTTGATVAVVDSQLRRLDRDAVQALHAAGLRVVILAPHDEREQWLAIGVDEVVHSTDPAALLTSVLSGLPHSTHSTHSTSASSPADTTAAPPLGKIVAVWGPVGAPGRTSVAITLADELARNASRTVLVDADTYGASIGVQLGLLDDTSGLAAVTRLATVGRLDARSLQRAAVSLPSGLSVLTGLARADRWPELRAASLQAVLAQAAQLFDVVVVDVGFGLGAGVVVGAGLGPPDRDEAALATLAVADVLVAVGSADAVGLVRLARDLGAASSSAPAAMLEVVVNKVRKTSVGFRPESAIASVLPLQQSATLVPNDPGAFDRAVLSGRTLGEVAASSPARKALLALVQRVHAVGAESPVSGKGRRLHRAG